ncbi:hypothetical protein [Sphingosinicella terrae]|jgi:hypothetical protein|uniref:hypothetical protein n=1 Tax=Sphingosinicella terrae TaxID=2172047 RepID=UPI0013B44C54|nr:hypothetical protein [Sphingosinicella terrae]
MGESGSQETDPRSVWNAREIARRNQVDPGRPLSPVMKTAATACELAHGGGHKSGRSGR